MFPKNLCPSGERIDVLREHALKLYERFLIKGDDIDLVYGNICPLETPTNRAARKTIVVFNPTEAFFSDCTNNTAVSKQHGRRVVIITGYAQYNHTQYIRSGVRLPVGGSQPDRCVLFFRNLTPNKRHMRAVNPIPNTKTIVRRVVSITLRSIRITMCFIVSLLDKVPYVL